MGDLSMLWLEITGKCQLECTHCYAASGPHGSHGSMTRDDWIRVIDDGSAMGVSMVQFIGGEPTLHPDFAQLVEHALDRSVEVEVYSNLVKVTPTTWDLLGGPASGSPPPTTHRTARPMKRLPAAREAMSSRWPTSTRRGDVTSRCGWA